MHEYQPPSLTWLTQDFPGLGAERPMCYTDPAAPRTSGWLVTLHENQGERSDRPQARPGSSQQSIKDKEARPPVPGDPARALGNGRKTAPCRWSEDWCCITSFRSWRAGSGAAHSRCSLNCSCGFYELEVLMNRGPNKPAISDALCPTQS